MTRLTSKRLWCALALGTGACSGETVVTAAANDNTAPAGTRVGDTLRINLVATMARWAPEADSGPVLAVAAFAVDGKSPVVPGPLIRVPVGTTIHAALRNALHDTLLVVGLSGPAGEGRDTLRLAPGARDSVRAVVGVPGSFAYYGHTLKEGKLQRHGPGEWLFGAFIADSAGALEDRVFVIKAWNAGQRYVMSMNGKSWPYTEHLTLDVGDTLRLRVLNGSDSNHPMHLHGFYYHVTARGTWHADTALAPAARPFVVTETLRPTQTMSLTWVPSRPGNWLFHCHDALHITGAQHHYAAGKDSGAVPPTHDAQQHLRENMAGLVLGIVVRGDHAASDSAVAARRVRLAVQAAVRRFGADSTIYSYALGAPNAQQDTSARPVLELQRGQRTAITVVNNLTVPTTVHWHGIELESYYDGVAGWSGSGARLAPLIMPSDSFTAVMTPPRAGTFIYHAHVDDENQIGLGLAGPLIVLEPGSRRNPDRDHVWLFHWSGVSDSAIVLLNGGERLAPLQAGVPHRIRIINITVADVVALELHDADGLVRWGLVAKDGADLAAAQAVPRPARLQLGAGETWDVVWTPRRGRHELKVDSFNKFTVPLDVRE